MTLHAPLLKYTATTSELVETDTVTFSGGETAIVAKTDPLTGTATIGAQVTTSGKYINQDGHFQKVLKRFKIVYTIKIILMLLELQNQLTNGVTLLNDQFTHLDFM